VVEWSEESFFGEQPGKLAIGELFPVFSWPFLENRQTSCTILALLDLKTSQNYVISIIL